jgi:hypothetical protein
MDNTNNWRERVELLSAFNLAQTWLELPDGGKELPILIDRFGVTGRQIQSMPVSLFGFRPTATKCIHQPKRYVGRCRVGIERQSALGHGLCAWNGSFHGIEVICREEELGHRE